MIITFVTLNDEVIKLVNTIVPSIPNLLFEEPN